MAYFSFPLTTSNPTGHVGYKIFYRPTGTTIWTSYTTSGTSTTTPRLSDNSLYDLQVENINNFDNPLSDIVRAIGFTDPTPLLSPTNTTLGYAFANLSSYITSYVVTIATATDPGIILQTQALSPVSYNTGVFSGLSISTGYIVNITVVAQEFTHTFSYGTTTTSGTRCAPPTTASAILTTSGSVINITWGAPTPYPGCNYEAFYRAKSASTYSYVTTSGTTSGATTIPVTLPAVGCYEGYVQADCCGDTVSIGTPFGVNAYQQLTVGIVSKGNPATYFVKFGSAYPNPYGTLVSGYFTDSNHVGSISFSNVLLPGGSSNVLINTGISSYNGTISGVVTNNITPIFDNGGVIQQTDLLLTPEYFQYILTSGTTWSGSPIDLPSFTVDQFNVTELTTSGSVNAGQLIMSWIYDSNYNGSAAPPYDTVTFTVTDYNNNDVMGSVTVPTLTIGLRSTTINLVDMSGSGIRSSSPYVITATWSDTSVISSAKFYLPVF